jgi:Putative Ig domain
MPSAAEQFCSGNGYTDINRDSCYADVPVESGARTASVRGDSVGFRVLPIILLATLILSGCSGVTSVKALSSTSSPSANLVIVTKSLPIAQAGNPYAVQLVASGVAPYHWTMLSGTLPPGLTLNSDGFLQGVPQQAGRFDFVVEVQDGSNNTARLEVISTIGEQA